MVKVHLWRKALADLRVVQPWVRDAVCTNKHAARSSSRAKMNTFRCHSYIVLAWQSGPARHQTATASAAEQHPDVDPVCDQQMMLPVSHSAVRSAAGSRPPLGPPPAPLRPPDALHGTAVPPPT